MDKHTKIFGIITTLTCLLLMVSGCTEQSNSSSESIQTILEKAVTIETVYYELDMSTTIAGSVEQTTTMKIWQKTPYLKEQQTSVSGNITTTDTFIIRPEGVYLYNATQNTSELYTGMYIPQLSIAETVKDLLENQTLTTLGTETIAGMKATVIQYIPSQRNSTTAKIWIWDEKGVPLQAQYITNNEYASVTMDYTYSNYSFADIPDSTFNVE
jgi:outer membrane lipoprotein-sorting protein